MYTSMPANLANLEVDLYIASQVVVELIYVIRSHRGVTTHVLYLCNACKYIAYTHAVLDGARRADTIDGWPIWARCTCL